MTDPFNNARKRQLARLDGTRPPTARAAMALAKSQAYQDAADAPATLRAYAADLANYKVRAARVRADVGHPLGGRGISGCCRRRLRSSNAASTRRRVDASLRSHVRAGVAGHPLDTKHPAIRETLRGIGRKHGVPARRAAALTTAEVKVAHVRRPAYNRSAEAGTIPPPSVCCAIHTNTVLYRLINFGGRDGSGSRNLRGRGARCAARAWRRPDVPGRQPIVRGYGRAPLRRGRSDRGGRRSLGGDACE